MTQEFEIGDLVRHSVEPIPVAVVWKDGRGQQWFRTEDSRYVVPRISDDYELVLRRGSPQEASIDRLRTAMSQSPQWAAALLQDLPQELRNDIATVLRHFIGDKT